MAVVGGIAVYRRAGALFEAPECYGTAVTPKMAGRADVFPISSVTQSPGYVYLVNVTLHGVKEMPPLAPGHLDIHKPSDQEWCIGKSDRVGSAGGCKQSLVEKPIVSKVGCRRHNLNAKMYPTAEWKNVAFDSAAGDTP